MQKLTKVQQDSWVDKQRMRELNLEFDNRVSRMYEVVLDDNVGVSAQGGRGRHN